MKKGLLITVLTIFCCMPASGKDRASADGLQKLTYGVEWNYACTFFSGYHYNFFAPEGHREFPKESRFRYYTNGDAMVHVGYNINSDWNISLFMGYTAIADFHPAIPVSIRATRYFGKDHMADRWFAFWDIGSGICFKKKPQEIVAGKIGGGYRISLSRNTKLDFLASVRMTYTHPQVYFDGIPIDMQWVNRNNAYVGAISFGIGLTF